MFNTVELAAVWWEKPGLKVFPDNVERLSGDVSRGIVKKEDWPTIHGPKFVGQIANIGLEVVLVGALPHLEEWFGHAVTDSPKKCLPFDTFLTLIHRNWLLRVHPDVWSSRAPVADRRLVAVDEGVL